MATERQIEANRLNATRSTGPKSAEGKARSRANATKHGLAGASALVAPDSSAEFEERRARWAASRPPADEAAGWALDRAVAASLRIDRCERAIDEARAATRERARLAWDLDRAVEAATVAARLATDPVQASRKLRATLAGAELMLEAWLGLVAKLESGEDWSEAEASKALDLLGVSPDLRSGRTPIDPGRGVDGIAFRRELGWKEVDRLEALAGEVLGPLDAMERRMMAEGESALLAKPSRLLLRYERDAWRRYREATREAQDPEPSPTVAPPPPPVAVPVVAARPGPGEPAVAASSPAMEGRRRAVGANPAQLLEEAVGRPMQRGDEPDWLDELDRRVEALSIGLAAPGTARPGATERTRSRG